MTGLLPKGERQQGTSAHSSADADHSWRQRGLASMEQSFLPLPPPVPSSIASACGGHRDRLSQFIMVNQLEGSCIRALRELPAVMVEWIMDQEFIIRSGPPSLVVARTMRRSQHMPE